MGVYIKGMEKPKLCYEIIDGQLKRCPFVDAYDDCVILRKKGIWPGATWTEQYSKCPLAEVPEPHGRLIDADALLKDAPRYVDLPPRYEPVFIKVPDVMKAPTVIEAEGK